ncbi:MAG: hypothetical protein U1E06_04875 [Tabrizicola sp.]|uniref:hypothetical protein n=1 Tax=Tabrizicola sp. TaxID=2005166 RepID=UPI0027362F59|nr:hypothetical protein [Tabrizicola sp.]MDP3261923.1 hypothetical protein [Tabrizicola sp.]MDP3649979.1 hypothetical protein [Paracoccaceae bacterium]MDZ4066172.1 hypothetical protein [Tabrizicola sp.]
MADQPGTVGLALKDTKRRPVASGPFGVMRQTPTEISRRSGVHDDDCLGLGPVADPVPMDRLYCSPTNRRWSIGREKFRIGDKARGTTGCVPCKVAGHVSIIQFLEIGLAGHGGLIGMLQAGCVAPTVGLGWRIGKVSFARASDKLRRRWLKVGRQLLSEPVDQQVRIILILSQLRQILFSVPALISTVISACWPVLRWQIVQWQVQPLSRKTSAL